MEVFQSRRAWIAGGAALAALIIAASWFLLISPERSDASNLRSQAANTQQTNIGLQNKLNDLKAKSANIGQYTTSLRDALQTLPFNSGLPAFTRQVTAQAAHDHVSLTSVTVSGVTAAQSATAATTPDATTGQATPAPAPSSDTTAAATAPAVTTPATGATAGTVYAVQVSLVSQGTLANQSAFLHDIQYQGPRRALVSSTQFGSPAGQNNISIDLATTMTTQLTVFSAPQTPAQIAHLEKLLTGKLGG